MKASFLKILSLLTAAALLLACLPGCGGGDDPIPIKVLILPKFESGEMSGDFPGEAQYYYEAYCQGGEEYEIAGGADIDTLYVKDGVALYITGMGKVNAALAVSDVLSDERFDFSDALILSTGCAGSAEEYGVMGDVYVISATVDGDLGHRVDSTELSDPEQTTTWFHDESYDFESYNLLDPDLTAQVYEMVKDVDVETTELTRKVMSDAFDGADWAVRDPQVLLGTTVTSDNYWKGEAGHANALLAVETYGAPDPYATTEMEDNAIAYTLRRLGMLDHLVILRDSVNVDVFMNGATPEYLWSMNVDETLISDDGVESADIFATAMENNFKVGSVIVDAALDGTISFS